MLGPFLVATVAMGSYQYTHGLFVDPLGQTFGWSRTEVSASLSFAGVGIITAPFLGRFLSDFGSILGTIWGCFWDRFWTIVGSILEYFLDPCWLVFGVKSANGGEIMENRSNHGKIMQSGGVLGAQAKISEREQNQLVA